MIESTGAPRPLMTTPVVPKAPAREAAPPQPQESFQHGQPVQELHQVPHISPNNQQDGLPRPMTAEEKVDFKSYFPHLDVDQSMVTAEATPTYNCISWSTGNTQSWDWPPSMFPDESPTDAFAHYYNDRGFTAVTPEEAAALDPACNEVVIYWENSDGPTHGSVSGPTHGARWESKCGQAARIQHGRDELISDVYGEPKIYYLKTGEGRPRMPPIPPETEKKLHAKLQLRLSAVDHALKDQFNSAYSEWQAERRSPKVSMSSDPNAYLKGAGYQKLLHLGPQALPLFVEKMHQGDFFCQYAVEQLSKKKDGFHIVGVEPPPALAPVQVRCGEQEKAQQILVQWLDSAW